MAFYVGHLVAGSPFSPVWGVSCALWECAGGVLAGAGSFGGCGSGCPDALKPTVGVTVGAVGAVVWLSGRCPGCEGVGEDVPAGRLDGFGPGRTTAGFFGWGSFDAEGLFEVVGDG